MSSEPFRPRLPLNPFSAIDHNIPWSIPQNLPHSYPQLILVLGEPPIHELIPLLTSTHLSRSLVLIATDTPPLIPVNIVQGPALRILRLFQPLAAHNAGALRLVSLFERAQRVAQLWPRDSSPHIIQLTQPSPNGDFSTIEPVSHAQKSNTSDLRRYPSPASSTSESLSSSKRRSGLSRPTPKKLQRTKSALNISDDQVNYKLFDAIINFIPHGLQEKALLKHAILVTTLSAQFLTPPTCVSSTPKSNAKSYPTTTQMPVSSMPSPSDSYSSASQSTTSPSSGSTPDTSPCPSPPTLKSKLPAPTSISGLHRRFSLFRTPPPPPSLTPRSECHPLPENSGLNENTEGLRKVKNAHLVHVLPVDWSPNPGLQPDNDKASRRLPSSSLHLKLTEPSRQPRLSGYFETQDNIGGTTGKPQLVQSIEQFLLSFAYPVISGNSSSGVRPGSAYLSTSLPSSSSISNKRPTSFLSSIPIISEESITTTNSGRPSEISSFKSTAKAKEQGNSPHRASTLSTSPFISSNVNTPPKSVPYLLAPGIFGRCVLGPNVGCSLSLSGCGGDDDLEQNRQDIRGDAYTDSGATALTIGEIILLGALDFDHTCPGAGPWNGRAWIESVSDVVIVGGGLDSRKSGMGKGKGRELEMMIKRNVHVSLPTPPESSSSNNSTENIEEEAPEGTSSVGQTRKPIHPALSAHSSSSHLGDSENSHWQNHARTRMPSGARSGKKVSFIEGMDEELVISPTSYSPPTSPKSKSTSQPAMINDDHNSTPNTRSKLSKRKSSSSISTRTPIPAPTISNSMQDNNTSHKVKEDDRFSDSLASPFLSTVVQIPPLVVHRDRARSPRGSEDSYDLGLGHGVPVPPMIVSKKPSSRSACGSELGLGSGVIPQTRVSVYGGTRSSVNLEEGSSKKVEGLKGKSVMGVLRKMGFLKSGSGTI